MKKWLAVAALVGAACSTEAPGENALGITQVKVVDQDGGRTVIGLDARGTEIARAVMTFGPYFDTEVDKEVDGRTLAVTTPKRSMTTYSVGRDDLTMALLTKEGTEEVNSFLLDERVSAPLAERGLSFKTLGPMSPAGAPAERPYTVSGCSFPNQCGNTNGVGCCEDAWPGAPSYERIEEVCCANSHELLERLCTGAGSCWYNQGSYPNCTQGAYCNPNTHNCKVGNTWSCCTDAGEHQVGPGGCARGYVWGSFNDGPQNDQCLNFSPYGTCYAPPITF